MRIGRRLTLRDLRILMIAVDAGSVSRAAAQLRVSQPAISKTITQLEQAIGTPLVSRSSRGITPTEAGRALLARSSAAFRELQAGIEAMDDLAHPKSGELGIAGNQVALSGIIPAIITRLYTRHPGIVFNVIPAQTFAEQVRLLEEEKAELLIARVALPMRSEHLRSIELFRDDFVVAAGPRHRWRRRKKVELAELVGEPWTFPPPETVTGQSMAQIFRSNGLDPPQVSVSATSLQLHQRLVLESDFLTFLPTSLARMIPGIHILPVALALAPQHVGVLTLKYRTQSPLAKLFIEEARAATQALHPAGPAI